MTEQTRQMYFIIAKELPVAIALDDISYADAVAVAGQCVADGQILTGPDDGSVGYIVNFDRVAGVMVTSRKPTGPAMQMPTDLIERLLANSAEDFDVVTDDSDADLLISRGGTGIEPVTPFDTPDQAPRELHRTRANETEGTEGTMIDNVHGRDTARMPRHCAPQTRFVTPREWHNGLPAEIHRATALNVIAEALVDAADEHGVIPNFIEITFYTRHIARVLNRDLTADDIVSPMVYDRFSALALTEAVNTLLHRGLLAVGDHSDTLNYHLTLPHRDQEQTG